MRGSLRLWRTAGRRCDGFSRPSRRHRTGSAGVRRYRKGRGAFDHLIQEAAMFRSGLNPRSVWLRQVYDKAIVSGLESERISTRRSSGADRRADFGHRPEFPTLAENVMYDGCARADTMEDEIVVDDLAAEPRTAKSGADAGRQCRSGITRQSARAVGGSLSNGPGCGRRYSPIGGRHNDFGDYRFAGEEHGFNDRTQTGGPARQQIRITKVLRHLGRLLRDCNALSSGPADNGS